MEVPRTAFKKQLFFALSKCETEHIAASSFVLETLWL